MSAIEKPEPVLCLDCGKDTNFEGGLLRPDRLVTFEDGHQDRLVWRSTRTGIKTTLCRDCLEKRIELGESRKGVGGVDRA